ncbi:MAG: Ig-like domain-containing protein, partial [Cytophagales bacterium]|nr:Ig-like domain-containing protein [Cytophagales bacterium]
RTKDTTAPEGYSVSIDQGVINSVNQGAVSFTFAGAETGAAYSYSFTSDGGGSDVTGNGQIVNPTDQVRGIDLSSLPDGEITLSVTLTDADGNTGSPTDDTGIKDTGVVTLVITSSEENPLDGSFIVIFTFSEAVTGFELEDIKVTNGTASNLEGSGAVYKALIVTTDVDVILDIDQGSVQDINGNGNQATQFRHNGLVLSNPDKIDRYLKVFPNPAADFIQIEFNIQNVELQSIIDSRGNTIRVLGDKQSSRISIIELSTGVYYLKTITKDGNSFVARFLKK